MQCTEVWVSVCGGWGASVLFCLKRYVWFFCVFSSVGVWRLRSCQTVKSRLWIALTMQHLGLACLELGCFAPYLPHVIVRWMWCHAAHWGWGQAWCWHTDGVQRAEARFWDDAGAFYFHFQFIVTTNDRRICLSPLPVSIAQAVTHLTVAPASKG